MMSLQVNDAEAGGPSLATASGVPPDFATSVRDRLISASPPC